MMEIFISHFIRTTWSRVLAWFYPGEVSTVTNIMGRGSWKTDVYDIPGLESHSRVGNRQIHSNCAQLQDHSGGHYSPRPGALGGRGVKLNCTFREEEEVVR